MAAKPKFKQGQLVKYTGNQPGYLYFKNKTLQLRRGKEYFSTEKNANVFYKEKDKSPYYIGENVLEKTSSPVSIPVQAEKRRATSNNSAFWTETRTKKAWAETFDRWDEEGLPYGDQASKATEKQKMRKKQIQSQMFKKEYPEGQRFS